MYRSFSGLVLAITISCFHIVAASAEPARRDLSGVALSFEENRGQADSAVLFLSRGPGYGISFASSSVTINVGRSAVTMRMPGSSASAVIEGAQALPGVSNYFFGGDPSQWITHVPHFERVRYRNIYPHIDLVFYGNGKKLEYDWIVSPGGDPNRIRMAFERAGRLRISADGNFILSFGKGKLTWRKPAVYQEDGGTRTLRQAGFQILRSNEVGFKIAAYDRTKTLTIDPVLVYWTYLGGSSDDASYSLSVDSAGDAYVSGYADSTNFPFRNNRYSGYGSVGFITKINPSGTAILGSAFIAGTSTSGFIVINGIAVEPKSGNVFIGGFAGGSSTVIPVTSNAFQKTSNANNGTGNNGFVAKLTPGLDTILYCSWLGGTVSESSGYLPSVGQSSIAVDSSQNLYVIGYTTSLPNSVSNPNGFPITSNAIQKQNNGGFDAFLTKIDPTGSTILYSTFIGGTGNDKATGVAVDALQRVYVTGYTSSCDFPVHNAAQNSPGETCNSTTQVKDDVFVTALSADGSQYIYSTYLGGNDYDEAFAIYATAGGDAYITGKTASPTHLGQQAFPTTSNAVQPQLAVYTSTPCVTFGHCNGDFDAFVAHLSPTGSIAYSTYYGGTLYDIGHGIFVQEVGSDAGSIFFAGETQSLDFPTSANAVPRPMYSSGNATDAFVVKIKDRNPPPHNGPLFSTYVSSPNSDVAFSIGHDASVNGASPNVYVSGSIWGNAPGVSPFPPAAQTGLYQTPGGGPNDAFAFKISDIDLAVMPVVFSATGSTGTLSPNDVSATGLSGSTRPKPQASSGNTNTLSFVNNGSSDAATPVADATPNNTQADLSLDPPAVINSCSASIDGVSVGTCTVSTNPARRSPFCSAFSGTWARVTGMDPQFTPGSQLDVTVTWSIPSGSGYANGTQVNLHRCVHSGIDDPDDNNNDRSDPAFVIWNDCQTYLNKISSSFSFAGGSDKVGVVACGSWPINNIPSWIHASATGSDSMFFSFTADPNPGPGGRSAALLIAGNSYNITESAPPPALGFFPITPCRAVDTRTSQSKTGAFGPPALIGSGDRDFPLLSSGCGLPGSAQAYSLNFTVVPPGLLDFLSAWPSGQSFPGVSTLNSTDGSTLANAAIVPAGSSGAITVLSGRPTDLIIDANGYFAPSNGSDLAFYPLAPCRVADTRTGQGKTGAFGPPSLVGGATRNFPLLSSSCNIPSSAKAYSLNMTAVPPGPLQYLSTWPADKPYPNVSTLNSPDGSIIANASIVPAAADGEITVLAGNPTDLIIDINGYFAPAGGMNAMHFYAVTPCRVADTRTSQTFTGAFGPPSLVGGVNRDFPILSSPCGIPPTAKAYSLNMTVVPPGYLLFLSTWPSGQPFPNVSTLNSPKGTTLANAAIVPAGANGAITVMASQATDLIIDINGFFAP